MKNKFCVYFHRNINNGNVFYVGKGTVSRPSSKSNRGRDWYNYVDNNGGSFSIEIYKSDLSNKEALTLEQELINSGNYPNLVNKLKSYSPTQNVQTLFENLYYDETSPTFLRWKVKPRCSTINIGDVAGSINEGSYSKVMLGGRQMNAHRVVWVLFNGEIPDGMVVNHKDCNKSNNSIENLEVVTQKHNCRRTGRHLDKESGVGVHLSSDKGKWVASFVFNNKLTLKTFSISVYGDNAKRMALAYREAMFIREDDEELSDKLLADFSTRYDYKLERDFPLGVSFLGNRFKAYFAKNGRELSKYFSIKKLGYQIALESAITCRAEMEVNYDNWQ